MSKAVRACIWLAAGLAILWLAACSPSALPTQLATPAGAVKESPVLPTATPLPTAMPTQPATQGPGEPSPTAQPATEERLVELEWPLRLRMGESDVVRLALVPSAEGYTATAEFPEHPLDTQTLNVRRPPGYSLVAVARLDGVGFEISPTGDQARLVPAGEGVSWRWSLAARAPGRQRLTVSLLLRWEPEPAGSAPVRESAAFGRGLDVEVTSFLGMGQPTVLLLGLSGIFLSAGLSIFTFLGRRTPRAAAEQNVAVNPRLGTSSKPNLGLSIEAGPGMALTNEDTRLLQTLFSRYARVALEGEFLSGYSGARTFLARPLLANGSADATTIVKIGPRGAILAEYANYEMYVKDRLPPVTARIQRAPVEIRGLDCAALQYTCIAEPGKAPLSLRQALLADPDPGLIRRLFETFGPNWWMQRQPYAFRLALEYDRVLPPHVVLAPARGSSRPTLSLDPDANASELDLRPGDVLRVPAFRRAELRADGQSMSLTGRPAAGQAALRVRWLSTQPPADTPARVTATRRELLAEAVKGFPRFELPDPLAKLDAWLQEPVMGTRSTIHGDLNLENILVGPGTLVWLIDFAETREGHPLFDFAHLAAQLIAHVLSVQSGSPEAFLERLQRGDDALLEAVQSAAQACLFDPHTTREYDLALAVSCLGALKYRNVSPLGKQCLYLTAAFIGDQQ